MAHGVELGGEVCDAAVIFVDLQGGRTLLLFSTPPLGEAGGPGRRLLRRRRGGRDGHGGPDRQVSRATRRWRIFGCRAARRPGPPGTHRGPRDVAPVAADCPRWSPASGCRRARWRRGTSGAEQRSSRRPLRRPGQPGRQGQRQSPRQDDPRPGARLRHRARGGRCGRSRPLAARQHDTSRRRRRHQGGRPAQDRTPQDRAPAAAAGRPGPGAAGGRACSAAAAAVRLRRYPRSAASLRRPKAVDELHGPARNARTVALEYGWDGSANQCPAWGRTWSSCRGRQLRRPRWPRRSRRVRRAADYGGQRLG